MLFGTSSIFSTILPVDNALRSWHFNVYYLLDEYYRVRGREREREREQPDN